MSASHLPSRGPVSHALFEDVQREVNRHGIVVWLDRDHQYVAFVDALKERSPGFAVEAFRGSHLALMEVLARAASGVDKPRLLIHLPGATEDDVRDTPLLELYFAGRRYRRALPTLVERAAAGKVSPASLEAFVATPELTLAAADDWLTNELSDGGELRSVLRSLALPALVDDLLRSGPVAGHLGTPEGRRAIRDHLEAAAGMPSSWGLDHYGESGGAAGRAGTLVHSLATWALSVEYVHDLRRAPVAPLLAATTTLPSEVVIACTELASDLRQRHIEVYEQAALEMEDRLPEEVAQARAEDLGEVDTFRFEEDNVLETALQLIGVEASDPSGWDQVLAWSGRRLAQGSFWLNREPSRQTAWHLVDAVAKLGRALAVAGPRLNAHAGHTHAIERYRAVGAEVDRAHRHLEQLRVRHSYDVRVPHYESLRARMRHIRECWFRWASDWSTDYARLCRQFGALPADSLQQRHLFDDVVRPLTESAGITAYFMVDALRFELAEQLHRDLSGQAATTVTLDARLAELPTNTNVGMNALAPVVQNGQLRPVFDRKGDFAGFRAGEFTVRDPDTRRRAMATRVGGRTCPLLKLAEILVEDTEGLRRRIAAARLVVVHSDELDKAGESGAGPATFDTTLQQLRAAWHALREAGVRRFVFTADHGFLLLDEADARLRQPHGQKTTPSRRHVLSKVAADHPNELRVPLAELRYEAPGMHLMVPESVKVFDRGDKPMSFVHGGNSLQERIIPVLTVVHRAPTGGDTARFRLHASAMPPRADRHCLEVRVEREQATLGFGLQSSVELVLRVVDGAGHQVQIHDAPGARARAGGVLDAPVGQTFQVLFTATGPEERRVRISVEPLVRSTQLVPVVVPERFTATGPRRTGHAAKATPVDPQTSATSWLDGIADLGVRDVFRHLEQHRRITEEELVRLLGSPRMARRFGRDLERYAALAPFDVQVESATSGKRYICL